MMVNAPRPSSQVHERHHNPGIVFSMNTTPVGNIIYTDDSYKCGQHWRLWWNIAHSALWIISYKWQSGLWIIKNDTLL